jgi:hypothetical protein
MPANSIISRADYENYLVYLYFGSNTDLLTACINRAYRDFNRTLHGFGGLENASDIYRLAVNSLVSSLESLKSIAASEISADIFDNWHKTTCESLISIFRSNGHHLFVGQAQKWVNMTLKYIFTLGEQRIAGFEPVYVYCHVPFDNILLEQLRKYDFPALNCAWSRLDDYGEYLEKQKWVRQRFSLVPMDVEFQLWLGKEIEP